MYEFSKAMSLSLFKALIPVMIVMIVLTLIYMLYIKVWNKIVIAIKRKQHKNLDISDGCPRCGGLLIKKRGKYGEFVGCSNFPKCRYTRKS